MTGGKFSRDKGARGEQGVVQLFRAAGFDAKRGVGQSQSGRNTPDVIVEKLPWLWVESKLGKKPNIRSAFEQAKTACREGNIPIAVTRDDRKVALVSMEIPAFLFFLRKAFPDGLAQTDLPILIKAEITDGEV